ncbi:MAG: DUF3592 domain-containing protein [Bacteroidales bacterium]|nr:DUF3592 domain-containing protein [Bacteroidales bacterium]
MPSYTYSYSTGRSIGRTSGKKSVVVPIVLSAIGALLVAIGVAVLQYDLRTTADYVRTEATIDRVEEYTHVVRHKSGSRTVTTYYADVTYSYEGKEYKASRITVSSTSVTGDRIGIYCDTSDPSQYREEDDNLFVAWLCLFIIGGAAIVVAVMFYLFAGSSEAVDLRTR